MVTLSLRSACNATPAAKASIAVAKPNMMTSLMENFFGILKNEMYYGHEYDFKTIDELKKAIEDYIKWYNEERINIKRKGLSPLAYRQQSLSLLQY